jgi:hypothetical protein
LRTRVAAPATMVAQLEHLARLAESLTSATIGVVPFSVRAPIASLSGYAMYDDLVTIETLGSDLEIADPAEVARYAHCTKLLLDAAMTRADAAALLEGVARAHRSLSSPRTSTHA